MVSAIAVPAAVAGSESVNGASEEMIAPRGIPTPNTGRPTNRPAIELGLDSTGEWAVVVAVNEVCTAATSALNSAVITVLARGAHQFERTGWLLESTG